MGPIPSSFQCSPHILAFYRGIDGITLTAAACRCPLLPFLDGGAAPSALNFMGVAVPDPLSIQFIDDHQPGWQGDFMPPIHRRIDLYGALQISPPSGLKPRPTILCTIRRQELRDNLNSDKHGLLCGALPAYNRGHGYSKTGRCGPPPQIRS